MCVGGECSTVLELCLSLLVRLFLWIANLTGVSQVFSPPKLEQDSYSFLEFITCLPLEQLSSDNTPTA